MSMEHEPITTYLCNLIIGRNGAMEFLRQTEERDWTVTSIHYVYHQPIESGSNSTINMLQSVIEEGKACVRYSRIWAL